MMTREELDSHGEPYLNEQWPYVVRAIGWLKKYGMKALIDLHGAPGSQNGWDNSGHNTNPQWGEGDTIERTLLAIQRLSQNIIALEQDPATSDTVIGLDLLNEPFPPRLSKGISIVKEYYKLAYDVARTYLPADKYAIVIDYAFDPWGWAGFMSEPQYQNVIFDLVTLELELTQT